MIIVCRNCIGHDQNLLQQQNRRGGGGGGGEAEKVRGEEGRKEKG